MALTLSTLKTRVGNLIQRTDSNYLSKIEAFIQNRYQIILDRYNWPQLIRQKSVTATTDSETLVLGKDIAAILQIHDRTNDVVLTPIGSPAAGARRFVATQDSSGTSSAYWREEDTVAAQPSSASVLSLVSDSASDTSQKVRIIGLDANGDRLTEAVNLDGTTPVPSTKTYTTIERISKDSDSAGVITITSNSAAVTICTIGPTEVAPVYTKIHLVKRPGAATVYTVSYKLKAPELINAEDIPFIPCEQALISGAHADSLAEQKQYEKAAIEEARFESIIDDLVAIIERQSEHIPQAIPYVEVQAIDVPY